MKRSKSGEIWNAIFLVPKVRIRGVRICDTSSQKTEIRSTITIAKLISDRFFRSFLITKENGVFH